MKKTRLTFAFVAMLVVASSAGLAWAGICTGLPAFTSCTAYSSGAAVTFNGHKYTAAGSIPASRDCGAYNPSNDNWWHDDGSCTNATPTPPPPACTAPSCDGSGAGKSGVCYKNGENTGTVCGRGFVWCDNGAFTCR